MTYFDQPSWLVQAWRDLGVAEAPGAGNNPRVVAYYRDAGHAEVASDDVAWCAAFVGATLKRSGIEPSGSLLARSYLAWGTTANPARFGSIVVLSRGSDPTQGHVGFLVGETETDVILLGGNQGDAVTVDTFSKSRLLAVRWPTPSATTPDPSFPAPSFDAFDTALAHVFEMEGGFTDDPYDPGGPTNLGITLATYAAFKGTSVTPATSATLRTELASLTKAAAREIYHERYWRPCCASHLPPALALMHFDAAVNHGVTGAARFLQQVVDVDIDGEIGPITLAAARKAPLSQALDRYAQIRLDRYQQLPHFWRFGRGWARRVNETRVLASTLLARPLPPLPPTTSTPKERTMTNATNTTAEPAPKWWGNSMTIWGTLITALSNVLPAIGPLIGLDITAEMIRDLGQSVTQIVQALGGIIGILLTIYGRVRAVQPLVRRDVTIKL